jgi:hypothetical protein
MMKKFNEWEFETFKNKVVDKYRNSIKMSRVTKENDNEYKIFYNKNLIYIISFIPNNNKKFYLWDLETKNFKIRFVRKERIL